MCMRVKLVLSHLQGDKRNLFGCKVITKFCWCGNVGARSGVLKYAWLRCGWKMSYSFASLICVLGSIVGATFEIDDSLYVDLIMLFVLVATDGSVVLVICC